MWGVETENGSRERGKWQIKNHADHAALGINVMFNLSNNQADIILTRRSWT